MSMLRLQRRCLLVVTLATLCFQVAPASRIKTPPRQDDMDMPLDEKKLASMIALSANMRDATADSSMRDPADPEAGHVAAAEKVGDDKVQDPLGLSSKVPSAVLDAPKVASTPSSKDVRGASQNAGDLGHWWDKGVHALKKSSFAALEQHTKTMLTERSVSLLYVAGFMSVLFIGVCCCWFTMFSVRDPRERKQHYHNGCVIYEWDQDIKEATIYIKPPGGLKKPDFDIKIQAHTIKVGLKGKAPFLRDQLYDEVNNESSTWSLRKGELQIRLVKARKVDWPVVCLHQKRASTSSATCSS